jgi:hypothetical protein
MAPRANWKGFLRLSLVSCPIALYPASTFSEKVSFNRINNRALLLQRKNEYAEAADYWRRFLANDSQSEWAGRARRSLKFCEMQIHLIASA